MAKLKSVQSDFATNFLKKSSFVTLDLNPGAQSIVLEFRSSVQRELWEVDAHKF